MSLYPEGFIVQPKKGMNITQKLTIMVRQEDGSIKKIILEPGTFYVKIESTMGYGSVALRIYPGPNGDPAFDRPILVEDTTGMFSRDRLVFDEGDSDVFVLYRVNEITREIEIFLIHELRPAFSSESKLVAKHQKGGFVHCLTTHCAMGYSVDKVIEKISDLTKEVTEETGLRVVKIMKLSDRCIGRICATPTFMQRASSSIIIAEVVGDPGPLEPDEHEMIIGGDFYSVPKVMSMYRYGVSDVGGFFYEGVSTTAIMSFLANAFDVRTVSGGNILFERVR